MRSIYTFSLFTLILLVLAGCDSTEEPETVQLPLPQVVAEDDYIVTDSGLKYFDLVPGDTTFPISEIGQELVVHYNAWLENGMMIESTRFFGGGTPITFVLGGGQVIEGWEEGLMGVYPGGVRQLVIPPDLAYGEEGVSGVPPNSTLIYEIDYLGFLQTSTN